MQALRSSPPRMPLPNAKRFDRSFEVAFGTSFRNPCTCQRRFHNAIAVGATKSNSSVSSRCAS